MNVSTVPAFSPSFDTSFAELVQQKSLISQDSPLYSLKPSTLDFSAHCWATCDLSSLAVSTGYQDAPDLIGTVASDVQAILHTSPRDASTMDYMEFWSSLNRMNSTASTLADACNWCNTTGKLDLAPSDLDFKANCTLTGGFYGHYYGANEFNMDYPDLVAFYKASLPASYQNITSDTIQKLAVTTWNSTSPTKSRYSATLPLKAVYLDPMFQAAAACAKEACRSLGYTGNMDLGGIGSLATYCMIAAITTIFAILSIHYRRHRDFDWAFRENLRTNVITTSLMFWDAVTWLAILTLVAALIVWKASPSTLYEAVLTQWVVYILINSVGALWALESYHTAPRERASIPQHIARMIITLVTWFVAFLSLMYARFWPVMTWTGKPDTACYADYLWPIHRAWRVATWFQAFVPVLWVVVWFLKSLIRTEESRERRWRNWGFVVKPDRALDLRQLLSYCNATLSLSVLWFDVACIIMFRIDARENFGESYGDDSFGYGQMLAAGFAVQPVINFFFVLLSDFGQTPFMQNHIREKLPSLLRKWWPKSEERVFEQTWTKAPADRPSWIQRWWPKPEERRHKQAHKYMSVDPSYATASGVSKDKKVNVQVQETRSLGSSASSTPDLPSGMVVDVPSGNLDMPESWPLTEYATDRDLSDYRTERRG